MRDLLNWLGWRRSQVPCTRSRLRPRFRPCLERLEVRETPARFVLESAQYDTAVAYTNQYFFANGNPPDSVDTTERDSASYSGDTGMDLERHDPFTSSARGHAWADTGNSDARVRHGATSQASFVGWPSPDPDHGVSSSRNGSSTSSAKAVLTYRIDPTGSEQVGDDVAVELWADVWYSSSSSTVNLNSSTSRITYVSNNVTLFELAGKTNSKKVAAVKIGDRITATYDTAQQSTAPSTGVGGTIYTFANGQMNFSPLLQVAAKQNYDELGTLDDGRFGTYLPNVPLVVPFTVTLKNSAYSPKNVGYRLDGGTWKPAVKSATAANTWTFTIDVGTLKAGDRKLDVGAGTGTSFTNVALADSVIVMSDKKPDYELKLKPLGGSSELDVDDVRVINGIAAGAEFSGLINNLPDLYFKVAKVNVVQYGPVTTLTKKDFKFTDNNIGQMAVRKHLSEVTINGKNLKTLFNDEPEALLVVARPTWMNSTSIGFNPVTAAYFFNNLKYGYTTPFGKMPARSYSWLQTLLATRPTQAGVQTNFNVIAPLDVKSLDPTIAGNSLTAFAKVLGEPVWSRTYGAAELTAFGTLQRITLNPVSAGFRLTTPHQAGPFTFFNQSVTIPIIANAYWGLFKADLTFALQVTGSLTANASVAITKSGTGIVWDSANTFFSIDAALAATASVTADVQALWFLHASLTAELDILLRLQGLLRMMGNVYQPQIAPGSQLVGLLSIDFSLLATGEARVWRNNNLSYFNPNHTYSQQKGVDKSLLNMVLFTIP